jgi:hypothetical protein
MTSASKSPMTATNDTFVDAAGIRKTDQDVIQRSRLRIETRMRVAGKLIPKVYGEQPTSANVNVGVQVGIVCDEETRKRLIAVRQSLAVRPSPGQIMPPELEVIEIQQPTEKETENVQENTPGAVSEQCRNNHPQPEQDSRET